MHRGYIKLWRCIQVNHLWEDTPFDRARAWIDLVMLANYKDSSVRKRGIRIEVKRGQVGWSERDLAERWKWSRGKVKRFLDELVEDGQLEQQNGPQNINVTSLITITNYDIYQADEPQNGPQTGHKQATDSTIDKKVKKVKKEKKEPIAVETRFDICIAWQGFVEMRKLIGKTMTPYAMKLKIDALTKLQSAGHDPVSILNRSIENNWQDIYPPKPQNQTEPVQKPEFQASDALKRKLAEYDQ